MGILVDDMGMKAVVPIRIQLQTLPCNIVMVRAAPFLLLVLTTMVCHALDPDDPRNLFANMYGGLYKRAGEDDPRNLFANMYGGVFKRRAEDDPRNLFANMYGGVFKRGGPDYPSQAGLVETPGYQTHSGHNKRGARDDPRSLFKSVYGGIYRRK